MHNLTLSIAIGIGTGIISSLIVLFLIYKIRPSLKISKEISRQQLNSNETRYGIKITNNGSLAHNFKIKFYWIDYNILNGKMVPLYQPIGCPNNPILEYPILNKKKKRGVCDDNGEFTAILKNLEKCWRDHRDLQIILTAKHPYTQITSLVQHVFKKSDIRDDLLWQGK